jgi:TIR domain
MREAEEFWEELLAQIEAGQVIPVVGPELLTVVVEGRETSLYQVLAERLLAKYGLIAGVAAPEGKSAADTATVVLRPYHELNDAVCALAHRGRRVQDLYRPIHDLLRALLETPTESSLQPLRAVAGISGFRLFVTTTPDDLLARAIDAARYGGLAKTEHIVFAPKLASGTLGDLPEVRSSGYTGVCYLFGKASPSPFVFAIHDEDTLEFIHNLQINAAEGMKRLFSELRTQNLLLIGCGFPDWLSRFFIRLSNTQRLADNRGKREFLIEQSADGSGSLTLFLERFSPDTWVFPGRAREFVAELARRWHERHPGSGSRPAEAAEAIPARPHPEESFFISYSRTDLAAARRLFAGLQEIGADVAWFDKSELKPGDDWEQKIRNAINGCYLFLPLVSANTETREEGFFREEWTLASERARRIQGRKFIVPVVVDRDYDGNAGRFQLVPESFLATHFGHAPEGGLGEELCSELTRLIRERRSQRPA